MKSFKLLLLPGDGIGQEIMKVTETFLMEMQKHGVASFQLEHASVGGCCYDAHGVSITEETLNKARLSDAILFGAVGGEKWSNVPYQHRPEASILTLRKELQLFANIRPAHCYNALINASSLKPEFIQGLDLIILREATGGVYFGEPKEITTMPDGTLRATDGQVYHAYEIERVARFAFELARTRKNKVTSVEKHNVMKTGILWKMIVGQIHHNEYPDVTLEHLLADNCAMQLVRNPRQFDVIVTDNLFGDILSDEAAMLTGSLGMLPSASLGPVKNDGKRYALYEPVHGSAPDIAGKNLANPIAMIGSLCMALRYSLGLPLMAQKIETAINTVLEKNIRTRDIAQSESTLVGTTEMGQAILKEIDW